MAMKRFVRRAVIGTIAGSAVPAALIVTPGGTVNLNVGVYNLDPTHAIWLFAHVWVGSSNYDPTVGTFRSMSIRASRA
jgi:hypothetical protein